jgi:UDP-glucose 4-epimerase
MNVLVTGGAGFVGTNLIKRLLSEGHTVVSFDNYHTGLKSNHQKGCQYIEFDIRNVSDYSGYGKFDVVYHLAAIARIPPSFDDPEAYFTTNANATMKLAKWCANQNIPLVYAGSSSHHSGKFKNPYTFSKDIGEEIIKLFQTHYGLRASIARFYNVYGPYQLTEGGYCTLIGAWVSCIESGLPLVIYGDGSKRRDFTHVDDIVDALLRINEYAAWNEVFELGYGQNYSVNEIAEAFGTSVVFKADKPGEAQDTLCEDITAHRLLNWKPTRSVLEYIKSLKKQE